MSNRSRFALAQSFVLSVTLSLVATAAEGPSAAGTSRLATFQKSTGQTYFALSLTPSLSASSETEGRDVLVLFDTSASQAGVYRRDALQALTTLLGDLTDRDRVKLVAVDLHAMDMTSQFVEPRSEQMEAGLQKLQSRTPLGSTDMAQAMQGLLRSYADKATRPRAAFYIGDGMSKANWLAGEFATLMQRLVEKRIPLSSYAIGPQRDVHLLATIANHTGGMVFNDTDQPRAGEIAGHALAEMVQADVIWPTSVNLPQTMTEVYPRSLPPLRTDRDTVILGTLADADVQEIRVQAEVHHRLVDLSWQAKPEESHPDLVFLPQLVESARHDGGLRLPTVGSEGLAEMGRVMLTSARNLSDLGGRALASGDLAGADQLASAALRNDPENPLAKAVRQAVISQSAAAPAAGDELTLRLVADTATAATAEENTAGELLQQIEESDGDFLSSVENQSEILSGKIRAEVDSGLNAARGRMSTDPEEAKQDLKFLLEMVERSPDLDASVRAQLRDRLESAIREASRQEFDKEQRDALAQENRAAALENQRLADKLSRENEQLKQLMDRFNSLMDEGRYRDAEYNVAAQVAEMAPFESISQNANFTAHFAANVFEVQKIRDNRHRKFVESLFQVEKAHIPHPDNVVVEYPSAEFWWELTEKRRKFRAVTLDGPDEGAELIQAKLDDPTELEFIETPLSDVVGFLEDRHGIQIELDSAALDAVGYGSDTPITKSLNGVSLRSALRLMLRDLDLTYMIQEGVLMITTPEEAEANLVTKVYPVGDLVIPITSGGGLGGGGGGGIGGGGGGGGFGGGGGGGIGGGGGGFGGGGGGGAFAVEDELKLGVKSTENTPRKARPARNSQATTKAQPLRVKPITLKLAPGQSKEQAWQAYFAKQQASPAAVRETVRRLMSKARRLTEADQLDAAKQQASEIVALIKAALRHDQRQVWMYEAMGLALQASGAPSLEVERALMSAVDLSNNLEDTMIAALYMSRIGLDRRALSLLQEVSSANPARHEPFVEGLRVAKRLDDLQGIQWACKGILSQAWPKEHRSVESDASYTYRATLKRLKQEQRHQEADEFAREMQGVLTRDCVVRATWTGDADIDIMVEEPAGTVCSLRNPRTTSGGVLLGDTSTRNANQTADGLSEMYVCPEGFSGQYRVLLQRVWGNVTTGQVSVRVTIHQGTQQEESIERQIELVDGKAMVVFDLPDGRRQEALQEHMVAKAVRTQYELSRAVMLGQLRSLDDSEATRRYAVAQRRATRDGRIGPEARRGGVGFRPQLTLLPSGSFMFATGVISADRRYVRVTPTPLFSSVGRVATFTFAGTQTGAGGTGGLPGM